MRKINLFLIFIICSLNIVNAETLIYDNISTNNYKSFIIDDSLNNQYFNDYNYLIYINNSFLGTYKKGEMVFYPDGSNITIYFSPPIKTNPDNLYNTIVKPTLITVLGFLFTWGLLILLILFIVFKIYKDYIRKRK
jgi:hypothetical protein